MCNLCYTYDTSEVITMYSQSHRAAVMRTSHITIGVHQSFFSEYNQLSKEHLLYKMSFMMRLTIWDFWIFLTAALSRTGDFKVCIIPAGTGLSESLKHFVILTLRSVNNWSDTPPLSALKTKSDGSESFKDFNWTVWRKLFGEAEDGPNPAKWNLWWKVT